jgi:2',3'-cyclic-nucleotide 2'-phosphodiesterase (5'-nucleotidase family)
MSFCRRILWACWLALLALLAGCDSAGANLRRLTILHTNDLHARFLPDPQGRGGFAQLARAIRDERRRSRGALVLFAGDLVQGTPVSSIFEGVPCYEVASAMGFDAATLGNHEFDYGWEKIPEYVRTAKFPIVAANVADADGRLLTPAASVTFRVNGVRVAVIGALTETLPKLTFASKRGPWRALPVEETVRMWARRLRGDSDLVVVLGHLTGEEEEAILQRVAEVNLVVSGHYHGGQKQVREVGDRLLVKVQAYGRELGRLDLEVDRAAKRIASYQWRRIGIQASKYPALPEVARLVEKWEAKVRSLVDVAIGRAERDFDRRELASLIETAMMEATGADLAYMNPGGVRDGLAKGPILVRHVWNILPFDNVIVYGTLRGDEIPKEAVRGRRIVPFRTYVLATNNFVAEQWKRVGRKLDHQGPDVREAMIDWIKSRKVLR